MLQDNVKNRALELMDQRYHRDVIASWCHEEFECDPEEVYSFLIENQYHLKRPGAISAVYALSYRDGFYIGASTDVKLRFGSHKSNLRGNRHHSKAFQDEYNKFKGEVKLIILFECPEYRLCFEEYKLIIEYAKKGIKLWNTYQYI